MNSVKFIMAARCEAAGRPNNEDNFQLTDNLSGNQWSFVTDHEVDLGEKGALLIVCDGMGGMNAGEVASKLAVESIKEWFSSDRLTDELIDTSAKIIRYIEKAIVAADARIKEDGKSNEENEGMGTTIVLAWIIGQSAFIGWCGDSRAYCFNPANGLKRLSHDHSYVQGLVDSGQISEDDSFNHPYGNIITRSLGDPNQAAIPDVTEYSLCDNDVIMLCSDGLCGVLRDSAIEKVMNENAANMSACRDALWDAARNAGWHDNVTIGLCRIVSGCGQVASVPENGTTQIKPEKKRIWLWILVLILVLITGFVAGIITEKLFFLSKIIIP